VGARPLVLLWNSFFGRLPNLDAQRTLTGCRFTADRAHLARADAVWFHLPWLPPDEVPAKRPHQVWAAHWQENGATAPLLGDPGFMGQVDLTSSHRRDATVWTPYFDRATLAALRRPPAAKPGPAPAACFVSSAYDWSRRVEYLMGLMARLPVDSYGRIFRNGALPGPDRGSVSKLEVVARYKFTLAFENAIEPDYVTEKFFEPLIAGSVPVYRGAPNVAEFAPGPRCFVDAADFAGPAALAEYLRHLAEDEAAYEGFLSWKRQGPSPGFARMAERGCRWDVEPFHELCRMLA
jgi:alpha-1,3-fucosyltransferase 10